MPLSLHVGGNGHQSHDTSPVTQIVKASCSNRTPV